MSLFRIPYVDDECSLRAVWIVAKVRRLRFALGRETVEAYDACTPDLASAATTVTVAIVQ